MSGSRKALAAMVGSIVTIVYAIAMSFLDYPAAVNNGTAVAALCISAYLLYAARNRADLLMVMLCIFYENYSIVVGCYLDPSIRPGWMFRQFHDERAYGIAVLSLLIFELVLLAGFFLYRERIDSKTVSIDQFPDNSLIMVGCMICYIVIFITQVDFAEGQRASSSVWNEYKFVLVITGSLYSKKTTRNKWLWTGLVGATSIATFMGGNRVNTLCNVFILAALWFTESITLKNVILISVPSIFVMLMVGSMRYNFTLSLQSIQTVWNSVKSDKLASDSFTFAYGPTIAAEEMALSMDPWQKCRLLLGNLIYVFAGGSYGKYSLANYTRNYYMHYFGFLGANYFDLWFGAFGGGIAGLSVVVLLFLKGTTRSKSTRWGDVIALATMANALRWYNYNFMQIFRTAFVISVVWYAAAQADKITQKQHLNTPHPDHCTGKENA